MPFMLLVVACYTICSLSDKYAVAKLKFNGTTLTFIMAAATAFFMLFYLPYDSRLFTFSIQSFSAIFLMALSKYFEFWFSAKILQEMSAFELKAWLGITLFISYTTDLITGVSTTGEKIFIKFGFIALTTAVLFVIAKAGNGKVNYPKIVLPLVGYLLVKYGYGLVVNLTRNYISPTFSLFWALLILTVLLAPKVHPIQLCKEKSKGTAFTAVTKIPNVVGLVCENIVAARSMADYSFIQPMILVVLFIIQLIRREECNKISIIGGVICILGIIGFQMI